jgi:ABC-2 type transport system permease protein
MPLFMLSPALFPLELLPSWLAFVAKLNPVTYSVLLIRQMMTGTVQAWSIAIEMTIICGFVVIMVLLASYVFNREVNKPF